MTGSSDGIIFSIDCSKEKVSSLHRHKREMDKTKKRDVRTLLPMFRRTKRC